MKLRPNSLYDVTDNELALALANTSNMNQKMFLLLTNKINKGEFYLKENQYVVAVRVSDLVTYGGNTKSHVEKNLEYYIDKLSCVLTITKKNEKGKIKSIMHFSTSSGMYYIIDENSAKTVILVYMYNPIIPYMQRMKNLFVTKQLEHGIKLNSQYSIQTYEYLKTIQKQLKEKYNTRTVEFIADLDVLKEQLNANAPSYKRWAEFKAKVLEVAFEEVNTRTDLSASFEPIRDGKKGYTKVKIIIDDKANIVPTELLV